jgi:hypothetical protein
MYFLPNDWNLIIYSFDETIVRNRMSNMEFMFYKTCKSSFTLKEYSDLLMSKEFWMNIPGENVILFQTDSYMKRKMDNIYINSIKNYGMIGAPYRIALIINGMDNNMDKAAVSRNRNFSMSGGFSFRKKSAMIHCIETITLKDIYDYRRLNKLPMDLENIYYEDFYFEHALFLLNYNLPIFNICLEWCHQVIYQLMNSYSIHGIYKNYVNSQIIYHLCPTLADIHDEVIEKITNRI